MNKTLDIRRRVATNRKPTSPRHTPNLHPKRVREKEKQPPRWLARILKSIKFLILLVPVLIFVYLGYSYYQHKTYTAVYTIDFNEDYFRDDSLALYIDELPNSPKFSSYYLDNDGSTHAQVKGSPINFGFSSTQFIGDKSIVVTADMQDFGDWEISLVCPDCDEETDGRGRFEWKPFYNGKIANYHRIASFDGVDIFTPNPTHLDGTAFAEATSVTDWLEKNYPSNLENPTTIQIYDDAFPKSKLVNHDVGFIPNSQTHITHRLRGPHTFIGYFKDSIDLHVTKQDRNRSPGPDIVHVKVYDLNGEVLAKTILDDDGHASGHVIDEVVRGQLSVPVPDGVYIISFEYHPDETYYADWFLTSITLNTNKLMVVGHSRIMGTSTVFFNEPTEGSFNFYSRSSQTATVTAMIAEEPYTFTFDPEARGTWQEFRYEPNIKYSILTEGNQSMDGARYSFNSDGLFFPFRYSLVDDGYPDVILAPKTRDGGCKNVAWSKACAVITVESISSPDKNMIFSIRNKALQEEYTAYRDIYRSGYHLVAQTPKERLFATSIKEGGINEYRDETELFENYLSDSSSISYHPILTSWIEKRDKPTPIFNPNAQPVDFILAERLYSYNPTLERITISIE